MTERPMVHIGYHRTATTWFQQRFYPLVRSGAWIPREAARLALIAPRAFDFDPDAARAALDAAAASAGLPDARKLICEENLSGYLHNGGLGGLLSREMARRIQATLPDADIVVFLRAQPAMVAAAYAQYVRGGGTHGPERYVRAQELVHGASRHWYKAPLFALDHFDYAPLLNHYAALFGRKRVHVFLFEAFAANPGGFLRRFVDALELDVDLEAIDTTAVNASLSPARLTVLRRLNLLTARSVLDKRTLVSLRGWHDARWVWLDRLSPPRPHAATAPEAVLGPELAKAVAERFAGCNRRLARDWDLPLADHGYPG